MIVFLVVFALRTGHFHHSICVKIMWKGCEKCVKKRNHVKSMLAKIQVHHISISHACELFDMHVKFCNTCEKCFPYVWTFFPCILLHVQIFSHMWNNFVMDVNFKFHMHNKCYVCEMLHLHVNTFSHLREQVKFLSGLVKCNHYEPHFYENAMNFQWISHENCKIKFHVHLYKYHYCLYCLLEHYI